MKTPKFIVLTLLLQSVSCTNEFIPEDNSQLFKLDEDNLVITPPQEKKDDLYFMNDD